MVKAEVEESWFFHEREAREDFEEKRTVEEAEAAIVVKCSRWSSVERDGGGRRLKMSSWIWKGFHGCH